MDFNEYTREGRYSIGDSAGATNIPVANYGALLVFNCVYYIVQLFFPGSGGKRPYIRFRSESTWNNWMQL